ncbi:MAG: ABC transporter ATP-binding protein [Anaerolineales bacterium]|nr:MAG: ABC transporter ATP-binding protein [Anaerolineales bacterium]
MEREQPSPTAVPEQKTLALLWRGLSYLKPYTRLTVGIYVAMLFINGINLITPQFIRWIIDQGIYLKNLRLLSYSVMGLILFALIKGSIQYLQGNWTEQASQGVAYDLRNQLQHKLNQLSFAYHDKTQTGQMLSRAMQDVERLRFLTGRAILRIVEGMVLMLGTAVLLISMNSRLAILVVLILPVYIYRTYAFNRQYRPLAIQVQDQLGSLTSTLEQNLRSAQIVKGFGQEQAEIERFTLENQRWFELDTWSARLEAVNVPLLDMIANIGSVLILVYGGYLVAGSRLTLGELVAFSTYLAQLTRPMSRIGRILPNLSIAASAAERVFGILDADVEVRAPAQAISLAKLQGYVRFDRVWFTYDQVYPILQDISFEVQPGQIVALLGATGSGKSTIVNLLARFYDPTEGRVLVDDIDLKAIDLAFLRRQIGMVFQDSRLFATTVRENIAFGRPDASEEAILGAARDAQVSEFLKDLPQGLDTMVGERGVNLSGGQKQRISIARALLTDPRILVLDDATSSVDARTENLIQQGMDRLMHNRTAFIIAHRLSTVRKANLILLLEKGRIIARGDHPTLMLHSPQYARIYEMQLRPQDAAERKEQG